MAAYSGSMVKKPRQSELTTQSHAVLRQRIYILPTAQGLGYALLLIIMLLGAINYDSSLGYALTFLLVSLALTSTFYTHGNLSGLVFRPGATPRVFAGNTADLQICVRNAIPQPRPAIVVRYDNGRAKKRPMDRPGLVEADLPADDTTSIALPVFAPRRGWLVVDGLTIATRHPFGLFRAWSPIQLELACLVYPRPAGRPELPRRALQHPNSRENEGFDGDDFAGLRDFRHGDSPKGIHWKAAAKGAGLQVKQFAGGGGKEIWLDWLATSGDFEERISQLALWVVKAHEQRLRFGLTLPSGQIEKSQGEAHYHECMGRLAVWEAA